MPRTVRINGEEVTRLRVARGWTTEDLAGHADCNVKTIMKIETEKKSIYVKTLIRIANALKVKPEDILIGPIPPNPLKGQLWDMFIRIRDKYQSFDEVDDLRCFLKNIVDQVGGEDEMEPDGTKNGSTTIALKVTTAQLLRILRAYMDGKLDSLNILSIMAPTHVQMDSTNSKVQAISSAPGDKAAWKKRYEELLNQLSPILKSENINVRSL